MVGSLAERLRAHERQKARLAGQEAKRETAGRKACTRQLIEARGAMGRAGSLDLESNPLYGASLRDGASTKSRPANEAGVTHVPSIAAFAPAGPARTSPTHGAAAPAGMWSFFAEGSVIPGAARRRAESPK